MSKYVDALEQARYEIRRLYWLCLLLLLATFSAMWGWKTAPRHLTAHIPPDLRNGATLNVGTTPEVPDPTVYTFAFYIWQQINRWKTDGTKDYGEQIYALQNYITPTCREQLVADMNSRNSSGELMRRTRAVMEIPGLGYQQERVLVVGGNSWKVLLDTQVQETQNGVPVKDTYIRYPIRVVRFDVDREKNPWQLAIDCFGRERPARLDAKAVEVAQQGRSVVALRDTGNTGNTGAATAATSPVESASEPRRQTAAASPPPAPPAPAPEPQIAPTTLPKPVD